MSPATAPARFAVRPLRIRPAHDVEPGILDEAELDHLYALAAHQLDTTTPRYVQSCLAVDFRDADQDNHFGPQATVRSILPDPNGWARAITVAVLESLAGRRPPAQFARAMTVEVYDVIARRHAVALRRGGTATQRSMVRRVAICEPADGVAEASIVVHHDGRVRALALRMSGVDGRWLITAFEMG